MKTKEFILPSLSKESFEIVKEGLKKQLKEAEENKEFIEVTGIRSNGKTTALVEYANENRYLCIVKNKFSDVHDSCVISETDENLNYLSNDMKCVIDEGVDYKKIKEILNLNIVTGFYNRKLDKNKEILDCNNIENFEKVLVEILKEEAKQLSKKIAKSRENGNYGTYKNLILSLKEVLKLIQEYERFYFNKK